MKVKEILQEKVGNLKSGRFKYGKRVGSQTLPGYSRAGQTPTKPKPRPKKNLWFQNFNNWNADLRFDKGDFTLWRMQQNSVEEEEVLYAADSTGVNCYGYWNTNQSHGMTFHRSKPINFVKKGRGKLELVNKNFENYKKLSPR